MLFVHVFIASAIDLIFGDPRWRFHPIRMIGDLITATENIVRKFEKNLNSFVCGIIVVIFVCAVTLVCVAILYQAAGMINKFTQSVIAVLLIFFLLALGDLLKHSRAVYSDLRSNDLSRARKSVSMIVGRETEQMDRGDVTRACIESVSENVVDGVTAPLFWLVIGPLLLSPWQLDPLMSALLSGFFFKAINTMDSMIGYKNEQYIEFGRFAAKMDDWLNYLPARISGLCVVIAAYLLRYDYSQSLDTLLNDSAKTSSPNSGYTESAFAGALTVRLGGPATYEGITIEKEFMGTEFHDPENEDIIRANKLALVSVATFGLFLLVFHLISSAFLYG